MGSDLVINGETDGISAFLDWSAYDAQSQEGVAIYMIYAETETFSAVDGLQAKATVSAENQSHTLDGLERGETYYFAVVPVDDAENAHTQVSPLEPVTLVDTTPPGRVHKVRVEQCRETSLTIMWDHCPNSDNDLENYRVCVNDEETGTLIDPEQNTLELTGLSAASRYEVSVSAIDSSGNESWPVTIDCATLLDNPQNLKITPHYGSFILSWNGVGPADLVQHYAIYISQSPFDSVAEMEPVKIVSKYSVPNNKTTVYGLESRNTYYVAVTTVNISHGIQTAVASQAGTPLFATVVSGDITENTTWTAENSPYVVSDDVIIRHPETSKETAVLTIEPGTEVRFAPGTGLFVGYHGEFEGNAGSHQGALSAAGTPQAPIVFTSNGGISDYEIIPEAELFAESSHPDAMPGPGDWKGIYFSDQTDDEKTLLENCTVEYAGYREAAMTSLGSSDAGYDYGEYYHRSNIYMEDASPTLIADCTIKNSSGYGIYLKDSSPVIDGCIFENNGLSGIFAAGDSYAQMTGNYFLDNNGACITTAPDLLSMVADNSGSGNRTNGIEIRSGSVSSDEVIWRKQSLPFIVSGNVTVGHSDASGDTATLIIEPGTEIRFDRRFTGLYIGYHEQQGPHSGALSAVGTPEDPIVFTSHSETPGMGDWEGIYFREETDDELTRLKHCRIQYGGKTNDANLYFDKADPGFISDCKIEYSSKHGVYLDNASPAIDNCVIANNRNDGIYAAGNSYVRVENNDFSNNKGACINTHPDRNFNISGNTGTGNGINGIRIQGGYIESKQVTWKAQSLPLIVTDDVTVHYQKFNRDTATLTIEPGTEIRFDPGTHLQIGRGYTWYGRKYSYYGALSAVGTPDAPIVFTSNADTPAPGDWGGIRFKDQTDDNASRIEHALIEYGDMEGNISLYKAAPVIRKNTIRAGNRGIYAGEIGSSSAVITCNNISENMDGIYIYSNASPQIENNNFLGNINYGIYNNSESIPAENNWWGDPDGPGQGGDAFYGEVDAVPFLAAESECSTVSDANESPFAPASPSPADGETKIRVKEEGASIPVTLSWQCTDPNPSNTLLFDLRLGPTRENMTLVTENAESLQYTASDLEEGTTYYWQVTARDNHGTETRGPTWSFTTHGEQPDLALTNISWNPPQISAGERITLTARVENTGGGPVVDPFEVRFLVNDMEIHTATVDQMLRVGDAVSVEAVWTAGHGDCTIEVVADSTDVFSEPDEENNRLVENPISVQDDAPPVVRATVPSDGARIQEAHQIIIVLEDNYGQVDDAAVTESLFLEHGRNGLISGSISESEDTFAFVPDNLPLPAGTYSVSFTSADMAGNTREHRFTFVIDNQEPSAALVTGGSVYSGTIQARPASNQSNTALITLEGTRDAGTGVVINGVTMARPGVGPDWRSQYLLTEGENAIEIRLKDEAGNPGPAVWVDILLDTTAPEVTAVVPENNTFLSAPPPSVTVAVNEPGAGTDLDNSLLRVQNSDGNVVNGQWELINDHDLRFTPAKVFSDSQYTVSLQIRDNLENQGPLQEFTFTVDTTAPAAPEIFPVTSPTDNPSPRISGTKESLAAIRINGENRIDHTQTTSWEHTLSLADGLNMFTVKAVDRAGNESKPAEIAIVYDDVSPLPVETLAADGDSDGTFAVLDWTGYDESLHGDIDYYRVYISDSEFHDVSDMEEPLDTVDAGTFTYQATGLEKGEKYWFAVVAVDKTGLSDNSVTSVSATIADVVPPEDVTELTADSFEDRLVFSWTGSEDSAKDLSGYRIYFDGIQQGEQFPEDQRTWEATALLPATGYGFKITAVDEDGNESTGASITGATLLENPADLSAETFDGYVKLNWGHSSPSDLVSHYAVYVSATDFDSVSGMSPAVTANETSAKVAGLDNLTPYFFAVTALNISDGEKTGVSTITAIPTDDESGPGIDSITFGRDPFADGGRITESGVFRVETSDPAGVSRVEFYMDGDLKCKDYSPVSQCRLDIHSIEDGEHTLRIVAYDSLGNTRTVEYTFTIELAPPRTPVIRFPEDGYLTNDPELVVAGTAEKKAVVSFRVNGNQTGNTVETDESGHFAGRINLAECENTITARAENRAGASDFSDAVTVVLDTAIPAAPSGLTAKARETGRIRLSWNAVNAEGIAGYHLYRHTASFDSVAQAEQLTQSLIRTSSYTDLPDTDGTYFYRATAVSEAGNKSALSNQATSVSDSQAPYVISISYSPQGAYDPETGAMAPGRVDVSMEVSESLMAMPFLSITPEGGTPIPVELSGVSDTNYTGSFTILESTSSGTAWAVFSGRDKVGNRGTQISDGGSVEIDTHAPEVTRLNVFPASPIRNDDQAKITAVLGLDEPVADGQTPQIQYRLSAKGRQAMPVDALSETAPQADDAQAWQVEFLLPADGGLEEPEILSFVYEGTDHLGNTGSTISADNAFQVYQGELPPLETPTGFTGTPLPGGEIRLSWQPVAGAAGYQLFRMGPEEDEIAAHGDLLEDSCEQYVDSTAADGIYTYAIASIRQENEQTSQSAQSEPVAVRADSQAPAAPQDLSLNLASNGIHAAWTSPGYSETVTFSLYRSQADEITSLEGLSPVVKGIEMENTSVVDPDPSPSEHCYAVAAEDAAGNVSEPSNSVYLNFELLPVASMTVEQTDLQPPVLSWTHAGGVAGCNIYLGQGEGRQQLNSELIAETAYTDTGYTEDERTYTVVAVDENGHESLPRTITLPPVEFEPAPDAKIRRGIMNAVDYTITSNASAEIPSARLHAEVNGRDHVSETFSMLPGRTKTVPVVVGGYDDLPDIADAAATLEITEEQNETIRISRTGTLEVADGMLELRMAAEEFTRGGTGAVRFTLENTCDEPIEIITAKKSGKKPSDEIIVFLEDKDGNVIASENFQCATGEDVVTLANGNTVARLAPDASFAAAPVELTVPGDAPDELTARVFIENIYYHHNRTDEVVMAGMSARTGVSLVDTAYYGEIADVSPKTSTGDTDVTITGRAIDRDTDAPLSGASLNLVISNDGFEREQTVHTDPDGRFSYPFSPLAGESGTYKVCAVHPDLTERPVQAQFVISRVSLEYAGYKLTIPRNFEHTVSVRATAGMGTTVNSLCFEYHAEDQPDGVKPEGVHVTCGDAVDALYSQQTANVSFSAWADNNADAEGRFVLRLVSDENPDGWQTLPVECHFREAAPALWFSPDYVETGTSMGDTVTETVTLENRGTAALEEVSAELVNPDGTPAPDWVYLTSSGDIGDMDPEESRDLAIVFAPPETSPEGNYEFRLRVQSANFETTDINLYAAVTMSGQGNVLFKVTDLYTGTLDEQGEPIQGLENARIRLQNEEVLTEEYTAATDALGEAMLTEIPAGRYKYRVRADSHQEEIGRIWVKPGITATEEVFLEYNLVTVEWEVTETTIEDKYDIVLTATYETDVPAPVVMIEPASVSLPDMEAGDVFCGEFTLTNQGLVRADEVNLAVPEDDEYFRYAFLTEVPDSIEAKERITVPYKVTCLKSLDPEKGDDTGGGCHSYVKCAVVDYKWVCANGEWSKSSVRHCWTTAYGSDCGGSGGSTGGGDWGAGGGGTGGWAGGSSPPATEMPGTQCLPECEDECCEYACCDPCETPDKCEMACEDVDSAINLMSGEYADEVTDLSVKVPGGTVAVKRMIEAGNIRRSGDETIESSAAGFFHATRLLLDSWSSDSRLEKIHYKGSSYSTSAGPSSGAWADMTDSGEKQIARVYTFGTKTLTRTGEPGAWQWRWQDIRGNWKRFDVHGRLLAYGDRTGTIAELAYRNDNPQNGVSGVFDKNGRQVLWYEYNPDDRISAVEDAAGRRVQYAYGTSPGQDQTGDPIPAPLVSVTDARGNETRYEHTDRGLAITYPDNGEKQINWDREIGVITSITYSDKGTYEFAYDYSSRKKERYTMIKAPSGMVKEIWYSPEQGYAKTAINGEIVEQKKFRDEGRTVLITDENKETTRKEYNEWGRLTRVLYPDGTEEITRYDNDLHKPVRKIDERGIVMKYQYDSAGNRIRKTEAAGTTDERVTEYTYDADGNLTETRIIGPPDIVTTMTYDEYGNMTSITDPEDGYVEFKDHDITGNPQTKIDARQKEWSYAYDAAGNLTSVTDPMEHTTSYAYDAAGNKIRETPPGDGAEILYEYDTRGNMTKQTVVMDPADGSMNLVTRYEFTPDGKLAQMTGPEGNVTRYEYDTRGRLVKRIDAAGNETALQYSSGASGCSTCSGSAGQPTTIAYPTFEKEFEYDARGRKTAERDLAEGYPETVYEYDPSGNLVSKTDKNGQSTYYNYDARSRLIRVTDPAASQTSYTYDNRDNLVSLTDAEGNTTAFEYDANNRLVKEIRPEGEETSYAYDAGGNLVEKIDAKDQRTHYVYDDAGQLEQINYYAASTNTTPVKTVDFSYDSMGNLTGYDDGITSASYEYDQAGRKVSATVDFGAFEKTYSYTYLKNGAKKRFTAPNGVTYGYQYDNNRLTGVEIPDTGFITINEYTWNRPASVTLPGGSTRSYEYDALMRIKQITAKDPADNDILNYQYDYDRMDNITDKITEHGDYGYDYDDIYRLTHADNPELADESFTYDSVGNRLTSADTSGSWDYNQNNELLGYNDIEYDYDANGNMTKKIAGGDVTTYVYNTENRLTEVWEGEPGTCSLTAVYYYDPFGRRLWKEVNGIRTYYMYADEGLVAEINPSGTVTKSYGWQPGSTWGTDPLFMAEDSDEDGTIDYYFYHNDHLGTPQKMTDPSGAVVWSATYSSFGEAHVDPASTVVNNLRFPGQYEDQETGLHYNFHRFYEPSLGKFFRVDPFGLNGGTNLFAYSQNNPINSFDSYGLKCIITYSDAFPSGEPLREWEEITYDGKLQAIILYASLEFWVNRKLPFRIPIPPEWFTYREIHQIVAVYKLYRNYFETCYDDCTGEKISGPKFIFKGEDGGTEEVILDEWTVEKTL